MNIISTISSTGASYSAIKTGATNAAIFVCFLKKLLNSVSNLEGIPIIRILLIFDNAPSHQAKSVLKYLEDKKIQYSFLPQYSPELTPVRSSLFFMKQKTTAVRFKKINLKSDEGATLLKTTLQSIDSIKIKSMWRHFYSKIRRLISETLL